MGREGRRQVRLRPHLTRVSHSPLRLQGLNTPFLKIAK